MHAACLPGFFLGRPLPIQLVVARPPVVGDLIRGDEDVAPLGAVPPTIPAVEAAAPAVQVDADGRGPGQLRRDGDEVIERHPRRGAVGRRLPADVIVEGRARYVLPLLGFFAPLEHGNAQPDRLGNRRGQQVARRQRGVFLAVDGPRHGIIGRTGLFRVVGVDARARRHRPFALFDYVPQRLVFRAEVAIVVDIPTAQGRDLGDRAQARERGDRPLAAIDPVADFLGFVQVLADLAELDGRNCRVSRGRLDFLPSEHCLPGLVPRRQASDLFRGRAGRPAGQPEDGRSSSQKTCDEIAT